MPFDIKMHRSPFVESPFYKKLLKNVYHDEYSSYTDKLNQDGYCTIDLGLSMELIDKANSDIDSAVELNTFKKNSSAYHYNKSPRIVEAWKNSSSIKEIATNSKLLDFLEYAYQSEPIPFSTINFLKGTEQPLHSDEFHFGSIPHKYLTGCWIALEDIDPDSGPISIAVSSHKLPLFSFEMIGLEVPRTEADFKKSYTVYEDWVREILKSQSIKVETPQLKKGECLIWLSNTLHGSYEIKNHDLTRKSIAIHYHYDKCEKIFFPSYSNLEKGRFVPRSLADLDIRNPGN
jgi:hypothetical protein